MKLPTGAIYRIKGNTKRRVLKGSAMANIAKGIVATPAALIVGVAGTVLMVVETCTIVGIVALAPTGTAVGGVVGKLTNGVNCTKYKGDDIKIRIIKTRLNASDIANQEAIESAKPQADDDDEDFD